MISLASFDARLIGQRSDTQWDRWQKLRRRRGLEIHRFEAQKFKRLAAPGLGGPGAVPVANVGVAAFRDSVRRCYSASRSPACRPGWSGAAS